MVESPVEGSRLMTSDGVELATRSWLCDGEPRAIVILVHGLSSTKDHPHVVGLAERLRARSLDVLSYDARGHGESGGLCTLGDLERNDVAAAVTFRAAVMTASLLSAPPWVRWPQWPTLRRTLTSRESSSCRVRLIGGYRFEYTALLLVILARTRPGRFVAERHSHVRIYPEWNPSEPPRSVAKRVASSVPLAIVHGRNDHLIPFRFSLGVSNTEVPDAHAVVVPGMGHAFDPVGYGPICDALDWVLDVGSREVIGE